MINSKLKTLSLFTTIILSISINLFEPSFRIGLVQSEEKVWECSVGNVNYIEGLLGIDWDENELLEGLSQGTKMKWKVIYAGNNETHFNLNISAWLWTMEDQWGLYDKELTFSHFINPTDYPDNLDYTNQLPFVPF